MPKTRFTEPGRLARDQLSTSSHANKQVTQFYKTHAFITILQTTENARAGGEYKGLTL